METNPMIVPQTDVEERVKSQLVYFIQGICREKDKYGQWTNTAREFINKYGSLEEVQERFSYWMDQPECLAVKMTFTSIVSEVVGEWRRPDDTANVTVAATDDSDTDTVPDVGGTVPADKGVVE